VAAQLFFGIRQFCLHDHELGLGRVQLGVTLALERLNRAGEALQSALDLFAGWFVASRFLKGTKKSIIVKQVQTLMRKWA
jgi:hypothetical protein